MKEKNLLMFLSVTIVALLAISVPAQDGGVPIPIKFDHRGLMQIDGILKMNSKHHWGASNLVIKPNGGWAAQDYCLKNLKKTKNVFTADFNTKPKLKMKETVYRGKKGEPVKVKYSLIPVNGGEVSYEKVYVFFPFATKDFGGGEAVMDDGTKVSLPEKSSEAVIALPKATKSITISNGQKKVKIKSDTMLISLRDMRPKMTAFQVWLDYPKPKNIKKMEFDFEVSCEAIPFTTKADGKNWVELPFKGHEIQEGSILDLSEFSDSPAGKYGRIINKDGHFAFEKTGKRVKLIGTNLCYTANYLEKAEADKIAAHFKRMGYNSVRFHHTDVHLRKGNWKSQKSDDVDPAWLDKLDYMFAAMKKAGIYVTIDLYSQRRFGKGEIEGIDKAIVCEIKGLVPIHEPAYNAWKKLVIKWMNHVNPYTGIAWKDDPALVFVCPLNEDTVFSASYGPSKPFYLKKFEEWKKEKNLKSETPNTKEDPLYAQFLLEVKMKSNKKIEKFFHEELGMKAMITGSNWWNTMGQTFTRDQFDVVDNHEYSDHPQPWYLPAKYNQRTNLKATPTYMVPNFMASTRIFGKPFTCSEYNYCAPNKFRAEGGPMMGAYAALQNWDGLYRFAWAHDKKRVNDTLFMFGFDMSSDPLAQLAERQIILMFGRGDVAPANKKYVYGVTMKEATRQGVGNMWSTGLFPRPFNSLGLISQTGSQIVEGDRKIEGKFDGVVTNGVALTEADLNGNKYIASKNLPKDGKEFVSDTKEITLNRNKGYLKISSPKTECIVAPKEMKLKTKNLSIAGNKEFCSISVSAMDGTNLACSKRILLLHLTNILNSEATFSSKSMTTLIKYGKLPFIVKTNSVNVSLTNNNAEMKLYACNFSGKRIKEINTTYTNGTYSFKAEISAQNPYMIFEFATE